MNKTLPTMLLAAAAAIVCVVAPQASFADPQDEALPTDQHTDPDVSPVARYQAALDQAEQNLRRNLGRCDKLAAGERAECVREANAEHDAETAQASDMLHRPR